MPPLTWRVLNRRFMMPQHGRVFRVERKDCIFPFSYKTLST